jgi:hypothetical protein
MSHNLSIKRFKGAKVFKKKLIKKKKKRVARAGERTRDLLISFIFSLHHFTAEPQRLP